MIGVTQAPLSDAPITAADIEVWARVERALAGKAQDMASEDHEASDRKPGGFRAMSQAEIVGELGDLGDGALARLWCGTVDADRTTLRPARVPARMALIDADF